MDVANTYFSMKKKMEELPPPLPDQCSNETYGVLNSADRNYQFETIGSNYKCDKRGNDMISSMDWQGSGWYRIMEPAGTKLAQQVVPMHHCNTDATGWMMGNHPSQLGQVVTRHVCFNHDSRCQWNIAIKMVNCGHFYVYYLKETSISDSDGYRHARYCTV